MKQQQLTKENFWNKQTEHFPFAMKLFNEWIDKYKAENNWKNLFNVKYEEQDDNTIDIYGKSAPKFHELPNSMQFGIFLEFFRSISTLAAVLLWTELEYTINSLLKTIEESSRKSATKTYKQNKQVLINNVLVERGLTDRDGYKIDVESIVLDKSLPIMSNFDMNIESCIGEAKLYKQNGMIFADLLLDRDVTVGYPALGGTVEGEVCNLEMLGICFNKNSDESILSIHEQVNLIRYEEKCVETCAECLDSPKLDCGFHNMEQITKS